MTARLLPVYLEADSPPESFARQLDELVRLAGDMAQSAARDRNPAGSGS